MPAVQLARLKSQINELTWKFTRPAEFQRELHDLLDFYSNQVFKPGKVVPSSRRVESFHVPPVILNQLELALEPFVCENPGSALLLADTLWKDEFLEMHLLAASLLGMTPISCSAETIQRLKQWPRPGIDTKSLEALFNVGARRLRYENQELWFEIVRDWLTSTTTSVNNLGVYALIPAAREKEFENLPLIFQMIHPLMENPATSLQPALIELLQILAKRTPSETLFFLKHHLGLTDHPATFRFIRRLIPAFDKEYQNRLKSFLMDRTKSAAES